MLKESYKEDTKEKKVKQLLRPICRNNTIKLHGRDWSAMEGENIKRKETLCYTSWRERKGNGGDSLPLICHIIKTHQALQKRIWRKEIAGRFFLQPPTKWANQWLEKIEAGLFTSRMSMQDDVYWVFPADFLAEASWRISFACSLWIVDKNTSSIKCQGNQKANVFHQESLANHPAIHKQHFEILLKNI